MYSGYQIIVIHFGMTYDNQMAIQFDSLRPSDDVWRHVSWSTMFRIMASCLMAPCHYLTQCGLHINEVLRHSSEGNHKQFSSVSILDMSLKMPDSTFLSYLPGANELITTVKMWTNRLITIGTGPLSLTQVSSSKYTASQWLGIFSVSDIWCVRWNIFFLW